MSGGSLFCLQEQKICRHSKVLGRFLRRLDSPVSLCMGQIEWAMMGAAAAEVMECIKTLPMAEAEKLLQNAFLDTTMVLSVVR